MQPRSVEMRNACSGNRKKENEHQRQDFHGRFKLTANHHAPLAAGEVLDQQKRHAAQADSQPKHKSEKISMEELIAGAGHEGCNQRQNSKNNPNTERTLIDGLRDLRRHQLTICYARRCHFCFSPVCLRVSVCSGTGKGGSGIAGVAPEPGSSNSGAALGIC